ncbi:MAG: PEP-CTERM sorting domain-containing protein [Verrucomicrobiota bacterium JB022]|nr:PEP-CTERM sorting domain-containing protein [Verrucomicrobiota bacterium JB022]
MKSFSCSCLLWCAAVVVQAVPVVRYTPVDRTAMAPVEQAGPLASASDFTRGWGLQRGYDPGFGSMGFNTSQTLAQAEEMGDYFEFSITIGAGYQLQLDELGLSYRRTSGSADHAALAFSRDGFAEESLVIDPFPLPAGTQALSFDLKHTGLPGFGIHEEPVTLSVRVYAWAESGGTRMGELVFQPPESGSGGAFYLEGSFRHVPEPATVSLALGLGAMVWVGLRRRRDR